MKRIALLLLTVTLVLVGCRQISSDEDTSSLIDNATQMQYIDPAQFAYATGNGEVANAVSKTAFSQPIECAYNGQTLTIDTPRFTGLPVEAVYSYKKTYAFIDGYVVFDVATEDGSIFLKVDKNGNILEVGADYLALNAGRDISKYLPKTAEQQIDIEPNLKGMVIGTDVAKIQLGDEGNYVQYLYSTDGERISDGYDYISYFYNGLAMICNDKKVGLIDEKGTVVLPPSIAFDTVVYPPTGREFHPLFMFEDAFIISIGGEFAVVNIQRDR